DKVESVRVDMGIPELVADKIPVNPVIANDSGEFVKVRMVSADGEEFEAVAVSMGNPHAVIFIKESPTDRHIHTIGREFEIDPAWPEKVNVEFARVMDRNCVEMRVWERGSGETLACGTGACATAVAGILTGLLDRHVLVKLLGGTLEIEWNRENGHVYMTGPAVTVARGVYYSESAAGRPAGMEIDFNESVT
ncbi:MAG: diaminopimelate epimerase, partial [Muribaculaceae bacterium]|nr:diaminopimelate epimerase [Muribaculaceae bacterium]